MKSGVIGAGPHGRRIIDTIRNIPYLELVAIVDNNKEVFSSVSLSEPVQCYMDTKTLWDSEKLDLVCVATNGPSHSKLVIEAIEAGVKYIMVEKPMACSIADCERMISLAKKNKVRLSVNQSRRHDPMYRWLRDQIRSGVLGKIRNFYIQRPGIGLGCLATHSFDLACFLSDCIAQKVTAWVDHPIGKNPRGEQFVDPGGMVIMEMEKDIRAIIVQIEDGAGPMSVEIDMTGGRIRIDEKFANIEIIQRDLSIIPGPGRPPVFRYLNIPENITAKTNMFVMLNGLINELISNDDMECDAIYGKHAVEVLISSYVSHRNSHSSVVISDLSGEDKNICLQVT